MDALWILSPNDTRVATMQAIHKAVKGGKRLRGIACEKPLARNLAEARAMVSLADDAKLATGYLENQVFSTAVERGKEIIWRRAVPLTGRPYLARAAEEHSGPHMPWFWQGEKQGGGVLSDMMCHSVEVARHMLTAPGEARDALRVKSVNASIANLKWTRPAYVRRLKREMGREVDYGRRPAEDFARGTLVLEDPDGNEAMIETTTSWAYVGAGLRIQLELLGPEYSMEFSSLGTGLKVFISRAVKGDAGEDLIEKQNAEQGLMPALEDEAGVYGYTSENRHMVECFRTGATPSETFRDGLAVTETTDGALPFCRARPHRALRRGGPHRLHPARGPRFFLIRAGRAVIHRGRSVLANTGLATDSARRAHQGPPNRMARLAPPALRRASQGR